jgi:hypothetical protein
LTALGHLPDLNEYRAWLVSGKKAQLPLKKAGVVLLECGADLGKRVAHFKDPGVQFGIIALFMALSALTLQPHCAHAL